MALSNITDSFDHGINSGHSINVGHTERLMSLVGGGLLAAMGLRRANATGAVLALAGGALVARGLTGFCPAKSMIANWGRNDARAFPAQDVEEGRNRFSRHPGDIYETEDCEAVDEASKESFPASDPPSFSPGIAR